MIKNIFFDFDGVIAESVNAKTEAFRAMFSKYGEEIANKVVSYHVSHGGVSRFDKFKYFYANFLGKQINQKEVLALAEEFSSLVLNKVIEAEEVKGVHQFIKMNYKKFNFWIITGTPTNEIIKIVKARKLDAYFKGVHGSPENKKHWSNLLIKKFNLAKSETLFIGDATTDYEAAEYAEIKFVLRETQENAPLFKFYQGPRISNFINFEHFLKSL